MSTDKTTEVLEVGYYTPKLQKSPVLNSGEIGYLVTGLKNIEDCRVGDTVALANVKSEMLKEGIPAQQIKTLGMGYESPLVWSDKTDRAERVEELSPNRRAEVSTN